jgi:hypothetical protein
MDAFYMHQAQTLFRTTQHIWPQIIVRTWIDGL